MGNPYRSVIRDSANSSDRVSHFSGVLHIALVMDGMLAFLRFLLGLERDFGLQSSLPSVR